MSKITQNLASAVVLYMFCLAFCAVLLSMDTEIGSIKEAWQWQYFSTYLIWGLPVFLILGVVHMTWVRKGYTRAIMVATISATLVSLLLWSIVNPQPPIGSLLIMVALVVSYFTLANLVAFLVRTGVERYLQKSL